MDYSTLSPLAQFIANFGFPIVACGALFWYMVKESRENRAVVENNTKAIMALAAKINDKEDG